MGLATGDARRSPLYRYVLYGLSLVSAEPIPGLIESDCASDAGTVEIRFGSVPDTIANPDYDDGAVQASATEYLCCYPGVLRLYHDGVDQIVVERLDGCNPSLLWTLVLGIGPSIAGFRRGFIPLHAAAMVAGEGCVALAGQSGFGKSTLAAALSELGFALHADDLCLIQPSRTGSPVVGSGVPELRLWDDAIATLGWTERAAFAATAVASKSVYRLAAARPRVLPLNRIYKLQFADEDAPAGIFPLHGLAALEALVGCLRLRLGLLPVGAKQQTFEALAAISTRVAIYRFVRPRDGAQLRPWSEQLAAHIATQEAIP